MSPGDILSQFWDRKYPQKNRNLKLKIKFRETTSYCTKWYLRLVEVILESQKPIINSFPTSKRSRPVWDRKCGFQRKCYFRSQKHFSDPQTDIFLDKSEQTTTNLFSINLSCVRNILGYVLWGLGSKKCFSQSEIITWFSDPKLDRSECSDGKNNITNRFRIDFYAGDRSALF